MPYFRGALFWVPYFQDVLFGCLISGCLVRVPYFGVPCSGAVAAVFERGDGAEVHLPIAAPTRFVWRGVLVHRGCWYVLSCLEERHGPSPGYALPASLAR